LEVVNCSKVSRKRTIAWLAVAETKGTVIQDLADSGRHFGRLDDLIASTLTKLTKGEVAREVSTAAEKLYSADRSLLTGRQLYYIMLQEFAEDARKTTPHAISDLSKLTCRNAAGLEHWLASFNSIVDLNFDLQDDLINFHVFEQLKSIDVLKTDIDNFDRFEEDDPAKNYRYLTKAVKRLIRRTRTDKQRVEIQTLNNNLPSAPALPSMPIPTVPAAKSKVKKIRRRRVRLKNKLSSPQPQQFRLKHSLIAFRLRRPALARMEIHASILMSRLRTSRNLPEAVASRSEQTPLQGVLRASILAQLRRRARYPATFTSEVLAPRELLARLAMLLSKLL
jgi:hypothetical protein